MIRRQVFALLGFFACAAAASAQPMEMANLRGRWVLETINGQPVPSALGEVYFQITGPTIIGFDGCNRFGGNMNQLGRVQKGQRGCAPGAPTLPFDLSAALAQLERSSMSGDRLSLPLPDGGGTAQFRRVP
ncbi:MAG: META domain-containing protein [Pseudorhodoplanes sp.]